PSGTSYEVDTTTPFTVSAGPHTITFQGLDTAGGDNTAFVDNVQVAAAPAGSTGTDFFTPFNQAALTAGDTDPGSRGVLPLPQAGSTPPRLVQTGKSGNIFLLDPNNMGGYNPNGTGPNNVVQQLTGAIAGGGSYDTPAYYNGSIYYLGDGDVLKEFAY